MVIAHHAASFRFRHSFETPVRFSEALRHPSADNLGIALMRIFYWWANTAGPLGVEIFFVISGFIITTLLLKEERETGRACLRCFYTRRVFRILPALTLFIACAYLFSLAGWISVSGTDVLGAATFLCNTSIVYCGYYFGHLWSLSVEEQFYIFWPLIFLTAVGSRRVIAIFIALAGCLVWSMIPSLKVGGWLNNGLAFACICAGVCYAVSARFKALFLSISALAPRWFWVTLLVAVLPLLKSSSPGLALYTVPITPFLIVTAVLADGSTRRPSKLLTEIGLVSYSLYLWHVIFLWEPERYRSQGWMYAALPIALAMTWFSAKCLERYFIRLGHRLSAREAQAAEPLSV